MKNLMINRAQNGQRRTFFSLWAKKVESLILFCCFLSATRMFAYDVERDGLYYNLISEIERATVTYKDYYGGDHYNSNWDIQTANIPSSFSIVTGIYTPTWYTYDVKGIEAHAFMNCSKLSSVIIGDKVQSIGHKAFCNCSNLRSIKFPDGVLGIGSSAFDGCSSLRSVELPNSITSISDSVFSGCSSLASIELPNSITSIGNAAFSGCSSLASFTIPNNVISIGDAAFSGCSSLASFTIPNNVISIGSSAFDGCTGLTSVICTASTPPTIDNSTFGRLDCSCILLYVPSNSVEQYKNATGWKEFLVCPIVTEYIYSEPFSSGIGNFTIKDVNLDGLDYVWTWMNANYGMQATGYEYNINTNHETESWLISPAISLQNAANIVLAFEHAVNKGTPNNLRVKISTDLGTSWNDLNVPNWYWPEGTSWNFVSTSVSLNAYADKNIQIAFVYKSTSSDCPTWEIKNFSITGIINQHHFVKVQASAINGKVEGVGKYEINSNVVLTVIPNEGYNFKQWSDGDTSNPRTIYVTQDTVLNAICEAISAKSLPYNEPFSSNKGSFTIENVNLGGLDYVWRWLSADYGMAATGYRNNTNHAAESWLISPAISLPSDQDITLYFEHAVNYGTHKNLGVMIFTDSGTSWNRLDVPNWPEGTSWNFVSTRVSLNAYADKIVQIAFVYKSTTSDCPTWEIKNLSITGKINQTTYVKVQASATNGRVEGTGEYKKNSNVILKVIPNEGYSFKQWSDGDTSNPRTIFVTQDTVLNAICEPKYLPYNEPFSANIGSFTIEDVTLDGVDYVWKLAGTDYGMKASAYMNNTNHAAESWLISPAISLPGDQDITLYFEHAVNKGTPNNLRVKISTDSGTSWNDLNVTNWPTGTNWNFISTKVSLNAYTDRDILIAFVYKSTSSDCPTWEIKNFSITGKITTYVTVQASATNGRVEGAGEYEINSNVVLKVIPNEGYSFKQWADGNVSNPRTIYVTQDTVLNAICEPIPDQPTYVKVQASATNGRVEGAGEYEINSNVVLTVIPNEGYSFKQWADGDTSNPRTIYLTQDTVLNAICEAISANSLPYNESFSSNIGSFTIEDVDLGGLDYVWKWANANYGMKASAYVNNTNHATESWLISPTLSLQKVTDIVLAFEHAVNKGTPKNLRVKISADSGISWNDLNVPNWPEGTSWNFVSTSVSLDAYADKIVQVAFVYKSTSSDCPTWEIKNFSITGTVNENEDVEIISEESKNSSTRKILHDGQVFIQRGDKLYTLQGQEVK